jgi:hypothetical protein
MPPSGRSLVIKGERGDTEGRAPRSGALIHYPGTGEKFDPPLRISRAEFWKKYQTYFPGVPPFFRTKGRPLKFHYRKTFGISSETLPFNITKTTPTI